MFNLLFQVRFCQKMYVRKLYCCDAGVEHLTDIFLFGNETSNYEDLI